VWVGMHHGQFRAPVGAIEAEKLRWYLESYYRWPAHEFEKRARAIEDELPGWGLALWSALQGALGAVLPEWLVESETRRRMLTLRMFPPRPVPISEAAAVKLVAPFADAGTRSAMLQAVLDTRQGTADGRPPERLESDAAEAAAQATLLALPWEMLATPTGPLFQRDPAVGLRRVLVPRDARRPLKPTRAPIRVLVVVARPDKAGLIDPRASADALIDAVAPLGEAVTLRFLRPPTVEALAEAVREGGFDVLHFDGHGVYEPTTGLGFLCFEHRDAALREAGEVELISGAALKQAMGQHRLPLAFLEACQSAQAADRPEGAMATALLDAGAESVIAMSHSVLVTTAARFTEAFYRALIDGRTVAEATTRARQTLASNPERGPGLRLTDWSVPVLFQRGEDPLLVTGGVPAHGGEKAAREKAARHETLPEIANHTFVGRLHERLAIERAFETRRVSVVLGVGGQGKTTLAAEIGRWLVRCERFRAAAFVSVEATPPIEGVLSQIGRALMGRSFVVQGSGEEAIAHAIDAIRDWLSRHPCLVVIDNFETLLPPPADAPAAETLTDKRELRQAMLDLAWTLSRCGDSRVLITCREPICDDRFENGTRCHVLTLGALPTRDAVALVGQICRHEGIHPNAADDDAL
ncbi:MAG: CHAT domain-containing protein, partial [Myxococcales bacterium]|nr:CHAT domain-containing protein [Myxococcales bacterium]